MPFADKEKEKEYKRQWGIENKEKRKQQDKIWRENNKEKIKEYRLENREQILERSKEYFKVKISCDCGSVFRRDSKGNHMKSEKHKQYLIDKIPLSLREYEEKMRAKYVALSRASDLSNIQIA